MDAVTQPITQTAQTGKGKSAQSVGHMAKAAVAEARASGIDVPRNAQGKAASAIAQGADPASVFAAQVVTEPGTTDGVAATIADPAPSANAEQGYSFTTGVTDPDTSAETALELLTV